MLTKVTSLRCVCFLLFAGCSGSRETFQLVFAGDLMLDRGVRLTIEKRGMLHLFEEVKETLTRADVAVANFECSAPTSCLKPENKAFTFCANPLWLPILRDAGIRYVSLANNHSADFGEEGLRQTALNLQSAGIFPMGYKDKNYSCAPTILEKNGLKVALFSSVFLHVKGSVVCQTNSSLISEQIRIFKKTHPDALVIVYLHWGQEFSLRPNPGQVHQAHEMINSGADVIIGHHPHVVQTIESYKGKFIFYSLGNFIFDKQFAPADKGVLLRLSLERNQNPIVQLTPFAISHSRPTFMNCADANEYRRQLQIISPSVKLQASGQNWNVLCLSE